MTVAGSRVARPRRLRAVTPLRSTLNLTRELAITQFKLKYTGSVLGYVWSLIKPLLLFGITYAVFVRLFNVGAGQVRFPMQLLLGIVIWTFFAEATNGALGSIVSRGDLLRKASFPRAVLVISGTLTATMTFVINIALVLVAGSLIGQLDLGWSSFAIIGIIVEVYLLALGIGLLLATGNVFYRDLGHLWEIMSQLLFYGSAVVYTLNFKPRYTRLLALNPMAQIINDARHLIVYRGAPSTVTLVGWSHLLVPVLAAPLLVLAGWLLFQRLSPDFAENL